MPSSAALRHECRPPYAYPDPDREDSLRVVLAAAEGDLAAVRAVYGDRYARSADHSDVADLTHLGSDGTLEYWGATLPAPTRRLRYWLHAEGKDGRAVWLTESGPVERRAAGHPFQWAYLHRGDRFRQPGWLAGAVLYQIFPDRFCRGRDVSPADRAVKDLWGAPPTPALLTGGDLPGIESKLDYLADLGVTCLYTTPLFQSPSNHKYDTSDYYAIDPAFGTADDLKRLVAGAHERGMRFLLDAVFNHSGAEWFAFRDVVERGADSPYYAWFYDLHAPRVDTKKANYETFADRVASMPKLDTSHPDCAAYLLDVAEHWIREADVDGWRLDVANEVDHGFWRALRRRVRAAKPDAFLLGEVWHDAAPWLSGGDQFDSTMNYPWRDATLAYLGGQTDAREYDRSLTRQRFRHSEEVGRGLVNLLGSHDTPRVRTVLRSKERAALGAVLLFTAPGVPMVYYGDEIGMEGGPDPDCRRCYPWDDPDAQDGAMLALYRTLTRLRRENPWLNASDDWRTVVADPVGDVFAFRRGEGASALLVAVNPAGRPRKLALPADAPAGPDLLAGLLHADARREGDTLVLPAHGAAVLSVV
jgi:glycosidase